MVISMYWTGIEVMTEGKKGLSMSGGAGDKHSCKF